MKRLEHKDKTSFVHVEQDLQQDQEYLRLLAKQMPSSKEAYAFVRISFNQSPDEPITQPSHSPNTVAVARDTIQAHD